MKHRSVRTTLILFFVIVLVVIIGLDFLVFNRLYTTLTFNKTVRSLVNYNFKYKSYVETQYNFLINYSKDPIFFRTEQNEYVRRQQLLYNDLRNGIQKFLTNNVFDQSQEARISQIKNQIDVINNYFSDIKHKLYLRGNLSLKSGYIGKIEEYYTALKINAPNKIILKLIDKLHADFYSYISTEDETYFKNFLSDFTELNKALNGQVVRDTTALDTTIHFASLAYSDKFLTALNEYKNYFRDLVQLDTEIGIIGNNGLLNVWSEAVNSTNSFFNQVKSYLFKLTAIYLKHFFNIFLILAIFTLLLLVAIAVLNIKIFEASYRQVYDFIEPLRYGQIPEKIDIGGHSEIGEILEVLNTYIASLHKTIQFAQELGKGRFDIDYRPLSEKDALGNSLLQLREDLKRAQEEEEKRKEEERIRQWTNEGISKFSELLRQKADKISDLANVATKNLVNYLNANQGAFFYLNDDDPDNVFLELIATYAYNKERKKKKTFLLGEGLVGTVALEKETTYMTDIPEDYVSITSGLGAATPRSLLIVPLKYEEQVVGVIEIASFNEMKDYEIKFVEQVGESIAATLSLTKINERTAKLLEMSQLQAREMSAKEEEMRQNLEELRATQEEAARREAQLQSLLNAIESAGFVTVLDLNGFVIRVNNRLLKYFGVGHYDIVGHHITEFDMDGKLSEENLLERVEQGETVHYVRHFMINGREFWFDEYFSPLKDPKGNIVQVIVISADVTENIVKSKELEERAKELEERELKLRLEMAKLDEGRKQLQQQKEYAEKRLSEIEKKHEELNNALRIAQEREIKSKELVRNLERERMEHRSQLEDFFASKEMLEYLHKKLEEKEKELKEKLYDTTRLLSKKDKRIKELEDKVSQLEKEVQRLKKKK